LQRLSLLQQYSCSNFSTCVQCLLIPVAVRSKAWVFGRSLAGNVGSNPARGIDVLSLVRVVCCQIEVSASGWSLVQRSTTERVVCECDREASITRRLWVTWGLLRHREGRKDLVEWWWWCGSCFDLHLFYLTWMFILRPINEIATVRWV